MGRSNDWLPTTRSGQLEMARTWLAVLETKKTAWGVPNTEVNELDTLTVNAEIAIENAREGGRSEQLNARVREAFALLIAKMRWIKKKYFTQPPLSDSDLISLLLKPPDTTPTVIGPPQACVTALVSYPGKAVLDLKIVPIAGHAYDPRSEYGFRIYYGVLPHGGADQEDHLERQHLLRKPQRPEELPKSFFTCRRTDGIRFEYDESAMTCHICIRYENSKGETGPWGPMVEAVIP